MSKAAIDYARELNEQQHRAVVSTQGPYLVIAGAGSGKTRVLVYRTAHLVSEGVPPDNILLLTFTRRASTEMLSRASLILDDRCQEVSGGTFHSFANMILRRYGDRMELARNFSILDAGDAEQLVSQIRTERRLQKLDKRFPKKGTIYDVISKSVNKGMTIEEVLFQEYPQCSEWTEVLEAVKEEYIRQKRMIGALDYDDLLVFLRDLLQNHAEVRERLSRHYRYLMIDEYQDTNRIQAQIVRLLAATHDNVMAVGDDCQSIYAFRGAQFRNIMDFPKMFPGAEVIMLEENYRSSQPILDLTNELIQSARERFDKVLFTRKPGQSRPVYADLLDEHAQSRFVARQIAALREEGVPLGEIAVLFRSGWHSNDLEVELARARIPFVKYGGQKFVEAAHVKDVLAYLQIVQNPLNQVAWMRVLLLLPGIGPKSAAGIVARIIERQGRVAEAIGDIKRDAQVIRLMECVIQLGSSPDRPSALLDAVLEHYHPLLADHYDDADKRVNDLESLQRVVGRYATLEEFLVDMTLEPPEKALVERERFQRETKSLTLSTIHSAKGLEWDTVFLIHLCEGSLPSYQSFDDQEALEEERRLFYVAATRAKSRLFLLRPQMNTSARARIDAGGAVYTRASRFLGEGRILTDYVEIATPAGYHPPGYTRMRYSSFRGDDFDGGF